MASPLPDYTPLVEAAVVSYWDVRSRQAQTSKDLGVLDTGIRSEVTGGRHLDELHRLIVRVFIDAGVPADMLEVRKRPIPGFFRRDKSWDVVVTVADRVVGIVELKSMAGEEPVTNYDNH
ncbi:MAG: PaeR7I family type II restriction endonuclease, partial [Actinomycetota bacterium]|nr:PaeR7I family type II restriction endonuclease [Actinomycetota bacterium]